MPCAGESIENGTERLLTKQSADTIITTKSECSRLGKSGGRKTERLRRKGHANTIMPTGNNALRLRKGGGRTTEKIRFVPFHHHVPFHDLVTVGCAFPAGDGL